jgi:hypothetical protein
MNKFEGCVRSDRGFWVWHIELADSGRIVQDSPGTYPDFSFAGVAMLRALSAWNLPETTATQ